MYELNARFERNLEKQKKLFLANEEKVGKSKTTKLEPVQLNGYEMKLESEQPDDENENRKNDDSMSCASSSSSSSSLFYESDEESRQGDGDKHAANLNDFDDMDEIESSNRPNRAASCKSIDEYGLNKRVFKVSFIFIV